jgi:LysR family transcriptional regulator, low CO2-responsive transcriptional regulator
MTLGQLRTFLAVARAGSVRGAAATLVVTEPSVSAALATLQREFEVDLVERDGRGIRLTQAGQRLAERAAEILGLVDRTGREVREAAGGPGHLRVVAATTAGEYVLPPILMTFRESNPGVQVSLEVGNRANAIQRLLSSEADLAVGGRPPVASRIVGEAFLNNRLVVIAHPGHPLATRRSLEPAWLSRETWLLREAGSGTRETTEEFLAAKEIEPRSVMTVGSNTAIKQATAVGLGVTLLSEQAVAVELEAGSLVRLPVQGTPLRRSWYVLYREGSSLPGSAQAFLELLRSPAVLQALPGGKPPGARDA